MECVLFVVAWLGTAGSLRLLRHCLIYQLLSTNTFWIIQIKGRNGTIMCERGEIRNPHAKPFIEASALGKVTIKVSLNACPNRSGLDTRQPRHVRETAKCLSMCPVARVHGQSWGGLKVVFVWCSSIQSIHVDFCWVWLLLCFFYLSCLILFVVLLLLSSTKKRVSKAHYTKMNGTETLYESVSLS